MSEQVNLPRRESISKIVAAYGSLMIPVALFVGTWSLNRAQRISDASERCHQQALTLFEEALSFKPDASPSVRDIETQKMSVRSSLLRQTCQIGNVTLPAAVGTKIDALASQAPVATVSMQLQTNGAALASERLMVSQPSGMGPRPLLPTKNEALRLYVHISSEGQRSAARALQSLVEADRLPNGMKITIPGIQLVDRQNNTTLRCLKKVDCERAPELAALIAKFANNQDIRVLDLSARYEFESGVRAGTYELWLSDGALSIRS